MNDQIVLSKIKQEPVIDSSLHEMCVRLGGCTLGKYSSLTGQRTDHLLIEFLRKDSFKKALTHGKN